MTTLNSIQQSQRQTALSAQDTSTHDPFLRKNQTWFHQPLPPSIGRSWLARADANAQNHLDQITARILDPSQNVERKSLVPRSHAKQLKTLHEKIHALENQMPETKKLIQIIQSEIALAQDFYAQRIIHTPC